MKKNITSVFLDLESVKAGPLKAALGAQRSEEIMDTCEVNSLTLNRRQFFHERCPNINNQGHIQNLSSVAKLSGSLDGSSQLGPAA